MSAPRTADYSLAAEGAADHLRNALMMLGGLRRALVATGLTGADAEALLDGITRRVGLTLEDLDARHEFGCTAYVGRPCICVQLRKQRGGA